MTKATDYITKEQLQSMNVGDEIVFTTAEGTRFRIKGVNDGQTGTARNPR